MPNIIYGDTLPPTPSGLSAHDVAILRTDLSEDSIQVLANYLLTKSAPASALLDIASITSGITLAYTGNIIVFTIPYTVLQAAATTKTLTLGALAAGTKVSNAYLKHDLTQSGFSSTLIADVGLDTADDDGLIAAADLKTAGIYGDADSEAGALLKRAAAVQGGYLLSAADTLKVDLTSASGNLTGISAGTLTISVELKAAIL